MLEAMAGFTLNEHLMGATFEEKGALGYHRTLSQNRKPFRTKDGYIAVLPYTTEQWHRALTAIGREDIIAAPWFDDNATRSKHSDELYKILAASFGGRTSAEWLAVFEELDIPCGPVNSLEGLLEDPHLTAVGFFEPNFSRPTPIKRSLRQAIQCSGVEAIPDAVPPTLGADTQALLAELGMSATDIERLKLTRVVTG